MSESKTTGIADNEAKTVWSQSQASLPTLHLMTSYWSWKSANVQYYTNRLANAINQGCFHCAVYVCVLPDSCFTITSYLTSSPKIRAHIYRGETKKRPNKTLHSLLENKPKPILGKSDSMVSALISL